MNRPSIIEVLGRYTDLQPAGRELKSLCLLHSENSLSLEMDVSIMQW